MSLTIREWFGFPVEDASKRAKEHREKEFCPFINSRCTKTFNDGSASGVCSVSFGDSKKGNEKTIAICPNRLYAETHVILSEIAEIAFGTGMRVVNPKKLKTEKLDGLIVVPFGKGFGSELKLPQRGGKGSYFVDWILARVDKSGSLAEFVAVEIQTIDTTGSYRPEVLNLRRGKALSGKSKAGLNWENVNKRILPQLIYKGHVLRREKLCTKGLFFVCPTEVYERIQGRLGSNLLKYENLQPGSITFRWYSLSKPGSKVIQLVPGGQYPTTVDQVANAFTSPVNLPEAGVFETAIQNALKKHSREK